MADMGFEPEEAKLALEGLLKRTEENWDYVEDRNYTALANSIFALQESGSKGIGDKSSRSPQQRTAMLVHPSQSKQGNQQTVSAIKSLEMMGFKEDVVIPVLKRLLKESDNNWGYIERDNYSALVDVILHLDAPNNDNAAIKEASSSSIARQKAGLSEKRRKRSANELSEHVRTLKRAKVDAPSVFIANKSLLRDPNEEQNDYAELEDHDSVYWPSACDVPMPDEPEGERYMLEEWHMDKILLFQKAGLIVLGSGQILQKTATHFLNLWSVNNLNKRGIGYNDNEAHDQLPKESPELYQRFVKGPIIGESQLLESSHAVNANDVEQGCHQGVGSSNGMVHDENEEPPINFNTSFSFSGRKNPRKKHQALVYCFE